MNKFVFRYRLIWAALFFCSATLLIASIYRALTFPFTHDESLSFMIFNGDSRIGGSANDHWVNTFLMQICSYLFGNSEMSLRLPNIIAHAIYLTSTLLFISRFQSLILQLTGFITLNLNPFVLDFFFLARGYGLALAFLMLSVYLLVRANDLHRQQVGLEKILFMSTLSGMLTVLSNFAFLDFYLPLLLASAILLFYDQNLQRLKFHWNYKITILATVNGLFLIALLFKLFRLQTQAKLYFGGKTGFIADTVKSLIRASLYSIPDWNTGIINFILLGLLGIFSAIALFCFYLVIFKKETPFFVIAFMILVTAVALPILQNRLLGILYPQSRTALFYLPLYMITMISAFDQLMKSTDSLWKRNTILVIPAIITGLAGWNFYRNFDLNTCMTWNYDKHNKEVINLIAHDRTIYFSDAKISLGVSWVMEPSLNFYRFTRGYTWLAPITRDPIESEYRHYIYGYERDLTFTEGNYTVLARYPDTETVLLRANSLSP